MWYSFKDMFSLKGKKVLLTGAAGGIGLSILKKLLLQGAKVFTTLTNAEKANNIFEKESIKKEDLAGIFEGDLSDPEVANDCVQKAAECMDGVDVFIHTVGITKDGLVFKMKEDQWNAVIKTNLDSAFHMSKACIKPMMKQRSGRIIFITSVVGSAGNMGQANYISSKAGLTGLCKGIATDCAKWSITCNAVEPGFIDTQMTKNLPEAVRTKMIENVPLGKMGSPDDVANATIFLASDEASYITGTSIRVNGGMLML